MKCKKEVFSYGNCARWKDNLCEVLVQTRKINDNNIEDAYNNNDNDDDDGNDDDDDNDIIVVVVTLIM